MYVYGGDLNVGTGFPAEVHKFDGASLTQLSSSTNLALVIIESLVCYQGDVTVGFRRDYSATPVPPAFCRITRKRLASSGVNAAQRVAHNHNDAIVVNDTLFLTMGSAYADSVYGRWLMEKLAPSRRTT